MPPGSGYLASPEIRSANRSASAMMVIVGESLPHVGNTELPAMYKLLMPWTWQFLSTTPRRGLSCIRVVPM
jgi:hypothetical protein